MGKIVFLFSHTETIDQKERKLDSFKWVCPNNSLIDMYKCGNTIERQITNLGFHGQEGKVPMNIWGDILSIL